MNWKIWLTKFLKDFDEWFSTVKMSHLIMMIIAGLLIFLSGNPIVGFGIYWVGIWTGTEIAKSKGRNS